MSNYTKEELKYLAKILSISLTSLKQMQDWKPSEEGAKKIEDLARLHKKLLMDAEG